MQLTIIVKNHSSTYRPFKIKDFSSLPRVGDIIRISIESESPTQWEVVDVLWQGDKEDIYRPKYIYVVPNDKILPTI